MLELARCSIFGKTSGNGVQMAALTADPACHILLGTVLDKRDVH